MSKVTFDKTPTAVEQTSVDNIAEDSVNQAWQAYEAKAEYKKFNKHDMIESMLDPEQKKTPNADS